MTALEVAVEELVHRVAATTREHGDEVILDPRAVLDRSSDLMLGEPGRISPNRSCRLVAADDGWIAVNLPRTTDVESVPAWLGCAGGVDHWSDIATAAARLPSASLLEQAALLGLGVAGVGETSLRDGSGGIERIAEGSPRSHARLKVIDLSALWAGPLCGAILAAMGAEVIKVESASRPDPVRAATPTLDVRLNGRKSRVVHDFQERARKELVDLLAGADVVISSARPRAFAQLGMAPENLAKRNPGLVWIAVTGHGWSGASGERIGFGDDCAAAGGLVRWDERGAPQFMGDALADPLTGLSSAIAGLEALSLGGGYLVDAALAQTAAQTTARLRAA